MNEKNQTASDRKITPTKGLRIKSFSATKVADRNLIDTAANDWLAANDGRIEVVEIRTLLSSDSEFHCCWLVIVYTELRALGFQDQR